MQKSDSTKSLDAAFLLAKKAYKPLKKSQTNSFFKKADGSFAKYADLSDVLEAITEALSNVGIALYQSVGVKENTLSVYTELVHVDSGEFRADLIEVSANPDSQKLGSQITYLRRYSASTMAGIAPDDDSDADDLVPKKPTPPAPTAKPRVNHTPAKPTTDPRPNEAKPEPVDDERERTPEEKKANNTHIAAIQKLGDAAKVREFIIGKLGEDHAKATKAKWAAVLAELQTAADNKKLNELIGA